ncbi:hypothetical protein GW916_10725 [bacterium]|nr:hypothetical protein [bacterium]
MGIGEISSKWQRFVFLGLSVATLTLAGCVSPQRRDNGGNKVAQNRSRVEAQQEGVEIPKVEGLKKRLWILDFHVSADLPKSLERMPLSHFLRKELSEVMLAEENSAFVPVLTDTTTLQDLRIDSMTPPEEVSRVARGTGVSGYIRGEIKTVNVEEKLDPTGLIQSREILLTVEVDYELIDSSTGRSLVKGTRKNTFKEQRSEIFGYASGLSEPQKKMEKIFNNMSSHILKELNPHAAKVGWAGRLLKIEGARLYLNAGRSSGLRIGDILKVVEAPRDVHDPQTGRYIGQAPGRVKGTAKVIEYFGLDGAVALIQSGGGMLPSDRVEMF